MLFSPQTELYGSDDTASRVPGLKRPVEQRQATPELITPQRHEENHSAVSHTHIHWEHRLILFPLVSGDRDFLMNQERFLKHLESFTLPSQFHLKVKSPFFSGSINDKSLFGLTQVIFVQFVWLFRSEHFDAPTHFIISFVCLLCQCLSDLISAREPKRSVQSRVMAPAQTLLNNWTDTFPLQFVEHSFRLRDDRR